jgi:hypothetical protein
MSRTLVNVRINGAGPCIEGWVDTGDCAPRASRPIYTMFEGGVVIPGAVITPAGACPKEVMLTPGTDITIMGQDCAGLPLPVTAPYGTVAQVVQAPGQVLTVRMCPTAKVQDREMVVLCAPDGTKVVIQNVTPEDAPLGTAPTFEAWGLNGVPYGGAVAALTDCGAEKVDISAGEDYCAAGVNYTRVDVISTTTLLPVGVLWLNDAGAPVAAPVAPTKGVCIVIRSPKIYLTDNIATLTMAQVAAAAGAAAIETVTVKQISGTGAIASDSGTGVQLDAKEVWSWDVPKGDTLGASALTFNAGTGKQHVTAIYYI